MILNGQHGDIYIYNIWMYKTPWGTLGYIPVVLITCLDYNQRIIINHCSKRMRTMDITIIVFI